MFIEDHGRRAAKADTHPGGFVDFILYEALLLSFFGFIFAKVLS